jgi:peptide-methionine (S)-S-oxide reductase
MNTEKIYFGAGCFWGVEAAFRQTEGIAATQVGYMGGDKANPTYEDVCSGTTGHAEVVEVEFDPATFPLQKILTIFWQNHNPTTKNRQGPDVGAQYRSVIFYTTAEQKAAAEQSKDELDKSETWAQPVVTTIEPAGPFWVAEEYHQRYLEKRGLASCHI